MRTRLGAGPAGRTLVSGLIALIAAPAAPANGLPTFTRILGDPAVSDSVRTFGANWADWNADGFPDLYSSGDGNQAYVNDGAGGFAKVTAGHFVESPEGYWSAMSVFGDWDNDGYRDLYRSRLGVLDSNLVVTAPAPDVLYRNAGPPTFELIPVSLGVDTTVSISPAFVDYDADGDLDLSVLASDGTADLFYRNDGGGAFTRLAGLAFLDSLSINGHSVWIDYDVDGDDDLYVVNHQAPNALYRSLRVETGDPDAFEAVTTGPLVSDGPEFDIAPAFGDYDNDGDPDLFLPLTNLGVDRLLRNDGGGAFTPMTNAITIAGNSTFGSWGDYDNDADLDLIVGRIAFGNVASRLFRNDGDGAFVNVAAADVGQLLQAIPSVQAGQWADYDRDGDLDMHYVTFRSPNSPAGVPVPNRLFRNEGTGNRWLTIECRGTVSNRDAVGARVRVVATVGGGPRAQTRFIGASMAGNSHQEDFRQHFGLGDALLADSVVVHWPSGIEQRLVAVGADQHVVVEEADVTAAPSAAPRGGRLQVAPNPFREVLLVRWAAPARARSVEVHDVAGRRVRFLPMPRDANGVRWDGTGDDGRPVPPGAYFLRTIPGADSPAESAKVIRMP